MKKIRRKKGRWSRHCCLIVSNETCAFPNIVNFRLYLSLVVSNKMMRLVTVGFLYSNSGPTLMILIYSYVLEPTKILGPTRVNIHRTKCIDLGIALTIIKDICSLNWCDFSYNY